MRPFFSSILKDRMTSNDCSILALFYQYQIFRGNVLQNTIQELLTPYLSQLSINLILSYLICDRCGVEYASMNEDKPCWCFQVNVWVNITNEDDDEKDDDEKDDYILEKSKTTSNILFQSW